MIHLDTNLLIAISDPSDPHADKADALIVPSGVFATSAVSWMEFLSRPVELQHMKVVQRILSGGIIPFDEAPAALAGEIFHRTGARRRTRMDVMIAATAIHSGAELATTNPADFQPFLPFGLKLHGI